MTQNIEEKVHCVVNTRISRARGKLCRQQKMQNLNEMRTVNTCTVTWELTGAVCLVCENVWNCGNKKEPDVGSWEVRAGNLGAGA